MQLACPDPLRVASRVWPTMRSGWNLTVVCKATFLLLPGESPLHEPPEPLYEDDRYWEDTRAHSLTVASDIVPYKPRADIVLVGSAYAPGRVPARSIMARLVVGEVNKSIEVFCDRVFGQDGQLREGPPIQRASLRYEHAAGGPDSWNPAGLRHDAPPDVYGRVQLPNLQPPGLHVSRREDVIAPIGFGPIAPLWPWRRERLGQHAGSWAYDRWWRQPLPQGFDPAFFNVAPRDQQVAELHDNERIVLENLHPDHPRLITSLPGARPRAVVERGSRGWEEVPFLCDTLWIDTDRGICTLVWRGRVALSHEEEAGRVVVSLERASTSAGPHSRRSAPDWRASTGAGSPAVDVARTTGEDFGEDAEESDGTRTVAGPVPSVHGAVLPFASANVPSSSARAGDAPSSAQGRSPAEAGNDGLPFVRPTAAPAPTGARIEGSPPASSRNAPPPPPMVAMPPVVDPIAPPASSTPWAWVGAGEEPAQRASIGQLAAGKTPASVQEPPVAKADVPSEPAAVVRIDEAAAKRGWKPAVAGDGKGGGGSPPLVALAALGGGVAGSSPAVGAAWPAEPNSVTRNPAPSPGMLAPKAVIELLWHEPAAMARIRRQPRWKEIIGQLKGKAFEDELSGDSPPEKRQEARDRRDVAGLLARGEAVGMPGIEAAIAGAVTEDGTFVPPLVLVSGELEFPFDELETLKATMAALSPLASGDKRLKETLDTTEELLKTPWLKGASGIAEGLTAKLKEVYGQGSRMLPPRYLENHTERILLEQRAYQKRTVLGKVCIRSLLAVPGAQGGIPVYLPESLGQELPSFQRLAVRMIGEVRGKVDQHEVQEVAVRGLAVGRAGGVGRR
ncbi:DUF2169 domain-containing protein [Sorangium sp. So ce861]|uniref:DUF2169 family type VI secretion system accessory protein n=1 Tax=Sorangium sp. So ce861 TaxID=3133323 RepID=UPI003F632B29